MSKQSYSQVLQASSNTDSEIVPNIIIKPAKYEKLENLYEETKEIVTKQVMCQINKVVKAKDKIIIKCKNNRDVSEIKQIISEKKYIYSN